MTMFELLMWIVAGIAGFGIVAALMINFLIAVVPPYMLDADSDARGTGKRLLEVEEEATGSLNSATLKRLASTSISAQISTRPQHFE